jgi:molybdate-binding protein
MHTENLAVFGNIGSIGGIRSLKQDLCHMATSHLLQEDKDEYNFDFIDNYMHPIPVVVNFCRRRQGLIVAKGNPKKIEGTADLKRTGLRIVNRKLGTGTRHLFDHELKQVGIKGAQLKGYATEMQRHMDVGLAVLSGKADAGPGIQPVAELLDLDFVPWRWERYDLLIQKERFFDQSMQLFLGLLHEKNLLDVAEQFQGYDMSISGKMVYPKAPVTKTQTIELTDKEDR